MSQYIVFTPEQFHALDDKLTEISQGGGGGIADGSVTTDKLADQAVIDTKIANGAIGLSKFDIETRIATAYIELAAVNSMTAAALDSMGFPVTVLSPKDLASNDMYSKQSLRLCWISSTTLEVAPITFYGNLQTQTVTLYAKGNGSTASGILGVDESWTITANQ